MAIVFLLLGLIVFGVDALATSGPFHGSVSSSNGSNWTISPSSWTSVTAKVTWSTNGGNGRAYVTTGNPTCIKPHGVLVNASGGHGTFSVTLKPGQTYNLFACNTGSNVAAKFSVTYSGGFDGADLLAIILFVLAGLLPILAFIPRKPDPFEM